MIGVLNERFSHDGDYHSYRLLILFDWYDDGVATELNKMTNKTTFT